MQYKPWNWLTYTQFQLVTWLGHARHQYRKWQSTKQVLFYNCEHYFQWSLLRWRPVSALSSWTFHRQFMAGNTCHCDPPRKLSSNIPLYVVLLMVSTTDLCVHIVVIKPWSRQYSLYGISCQQVLHLPSCIDSMQNCDENSDNDWHIIQSRMTWYTHSKAGKVWI